MSSTKLCNCQIFGCSSNTTIDPITNRPVQGRRVPRSTWANHRDAQQEADADAEAQQEAHAEGETDVLTSVTLLRTMASTNTVAKTIVSPPPMERPGDRRPSPSTEEHDNVHHAPDTDVSRISTRDVTQNTRDLLWLGDAIEQKILAFNPPNSLKFVNTPTPSTPYVPQFDTAPPTNVGFYALITRHMDSDTLIRFESWLSVALDGLQAIDCCNLQSLLDQRTRSMEKIHAMFRRLDHVKKMEWERQQELERQRELEFTHGIPEDDGETKVSGPLYVNTCECSNRPFPRYWLRCGIRLIPTARNQRHGLHSPRLYIYRRSPQPPVPSFPKALQFYPRGSSLPPGQGVCHSAPY
jgi:hypothetical protein